MREGEPPSASAALVGHPDGCRRDVGGCAPARTRSVRHLVGAVVAATAGLTLWGCGSDESAGDGDGRVSVLDRAAAADSSFGVRYSFRSRFTDDEGTDRLRGYGQAEADQRRTRVVVRDRNIRGETVIDGDDEYSGGSFAVTPLLDSPSREVRWTKLDRSRFLEAGYIDKLCGPELPTKIAKVLAGSDPTIEKLGAARVGELRTQRYRVTTTYGRVLDVLAGDEDASQCDARDRADGFVAELWIDRRNLIRRVRLRYRLTDGSTVETRDITSYDAPCASPCPVAQPSVT
jgi:hypothetical protein